MVLPDGPEMAAAFLTSPPAPAPRRWTQLSRPQSSVLSLRPQGQGADDPNGHGFPGTRSGQKAFHPDHRTMPLANQAAGRFTLSGESAAKAHPSYSTPNDEALVLHTSGTTSRPKIVPLSQRNLPLCARCRRHAGADDRSTCLNVMPLFHIHGLMAAVMASFAAGAGVICGTSFDRDRFFDWLKQCRPTWYTAMPTMHMASSKQRTITVTSLQERLCVLFAHPLPHCRRR